LENYQLVFAFQRAQQAYQILQRQRQFLHFTPTKPGGRLRVKLLGKVIEEPTIGDTFVKTLRT
jgi:hypothetical protein